MTITITAFAASPDEGQGLARDMRVRWALEEAGVPYAVRLVSFAALNTVEPPIVELEAMTLLEADESWFAARRELVVERIRTRLGQLAAHLGDAEWLDGEFSAGDLLMVTVLRRAEGEGILDDYPALAAYIARGEARPAYRRAFADQLAVFETSRA